MLSAFLAIGSAPIPYPTDNTPLMSLWIELAGVFIAALAAALASTRVQIDLLGVMICGALVGIGGGTIRDLLIDVPVFWVSPPPIGGAFYEGGDAFLIFAILGAIFAFCWVKVGLKAPLGTVRILDAIVVGLFAYSGCAKTLRYGYSIPVACVMGVITAVFGGLVRDVVTGNVPYILRPKEFYATAAFSCCMVLVILHCCFGWTPQQACIPSVIVCTAIRMASIRWNWNLPSHIDLFVQPHPEDKP